jgi:hypothetical protein
MRDRRAMCPGATRASDAASTDNGICVGGLSYHYANEPGEAEKSKQEHTHDYLPGVGILCQQGPQ